MEKKQNKDERDLSSLKGSERVRLKVNNMFGSDGAEGVSHSLFEIISNSIDRFKKGYGKEVIITRYEDDVLKVEDFADGLPMDWNEKEEAYNWDIALKTLYGGDNYEQSDNNDGVLGTNGLGLTSTQYASEFMNVTVYTKNNKYEAKFKKGRPVDYNTGEYVVKDTSFYLSKEDGAKVLHTEKNKTGRTGTIICFKPDSEVFTTVSISTDWIKDKLNKQAVVNSGVYLKFIDLKEKQEITYHYDSINDYIDLLSDGTENRIGEILNFEATGKGRDLPSRPEYEFEYNVAFAFDNIIGKQEYYHNSSELIELSKNVTTLGFEKALVNSIHKVIEKNKLYKNKEKKIKKEDILPSLVSVVNTKSTLTSYSHQTKYSINNAFIELFLSKKLEEQLDIHFTENNEYAVKVAHRTLINKRAREKAESTRLNLKKKLENDGTIFTKAQGLVDCKCKDPKQREIYGLEGISALGSAIKARNSFFQACIPFRGKSLNCLKADYKKILNNDVILNFIKALGCGIETGNSKELGEFSIEKLRYHMIILSSDADVDGYQIRTLILTILYRLCPTLIKEGYVYIVEAPLYEATITGDKKTYYLYDDEEKEQFVNEHKGKKIKFSRNKGLGEMTPEAMNYTMMNPETRRLTQVTMEDMEQAKETFELFLGENVPPRKKYIMEHYDEYTSLN